MHSWIICPEVLNGGRRPEPWDHAPWCPKWCLTTSYNVLTHTIFALLGHLVPSYHECQLPSQCSFRSVQLNFQERQFWLSAMTDERLLHLVNNPWHGVLPSEFPNSQLFVSTILQNCSFTNPEYLSKRMKNAILTATIFPGQRQHFHSSVAAGSLSILRRRWPSINKRYILASTPIHPVLFYGRSIQIHSHHFQKELCEWDHGNFPYQLLSFRLSGTFNTDR